MCRGAIGVLGGAVMPVVVCVFGRGPVPLPGVAAASPPLSARAIVKRLNAERARDGLPGRLGEVPEWSARCEKSPALDFVDYCLRGVGQVVFQNNPLTGLAGLLFSPARGLFVFSPFLVFLVCYPRRVFHDRDRRGLTAAIAIAKFFVNASGLKSRPSCVSSVNTGRNETAITSKAKKLGPPTSLTAEMTTRW